MTDHTTITIESEASEEPTTIDLTAEEAEDLKRYAASERFSYELGPGTHRTLKGLAAALGATDFDEEIGN